MANIQWTNDPIVQGVTEPLAVHINEIRTTIQNIKLEQEHDQDEITSTRSIADTAKTTADTVEATANIAKSTADTAKTTANNALTKASISQQTADDAKSTANTALSKINNQPQITYSTTAPNTPKTGDIWIN